jgi:glutaredoxin
MTTKKKIEVFSAGCSTCNETIELVKKIAGSAHEVVIHDMQKSEVASKAKEHGVRSVPAVVQGAGQMNTSCVLLLRNWSLIAIQGGSIRAAFSLTDSNADVFPNGAT